MNKELAIGLLAIAVVVALIAMLSPWWVLTMEGGGTSVSTDAGPFDKGSGSGLITSESALITGLIVLVGLIALVGAVALGVMGFLGMGGEMSPKFVPLLAFTGALFLVVAVTLAIFMYPSEINSNGGDMGFWDSAGTDEAGISSAAAWGWYMAVAGALVGIAGGIIALRAAGERSGTVNPSQTSGPVE